MTTFTEAAPNTKVAGEQSFSPASPASKVVTRTSVDYKNAPTIGAGSTFTPITAPDSLVVAHADYRTNVPI